MTFSDYDATLLAMTEAITNDIKEIFKKHAGKEETRSFNDCLCDKPILKDSNVEDGIYCVERVCLDNNGMLYFEGNNSYNWRVFYVEDIYVEVLLLIYKILKANEDELFADEE